MVRVGKFEKVSFDQYYNDMLKEFPQVKERQVADWYNAIKVPTRSTSGSAGYDFHVPFACEIGCGETIKIPTGIRVKIEPGWFLALYPRSSLGMRYRLQLDNTTGIVDSDFFYADNEGHIMAQITNDSKYGDKCYLEANTRFMQGIFQPYGITYDDIATGVRTGGMGSTGK